VDWGIVLTRKLVHIQENEHLKLKNRLGLSQSLLMSASLTVSLPDFLNSSSSHRNQDIGSPFNHFGKFFIFKETIARDF
jgi:hypothetical protein